MWACALRLMNQKWRDENTVRSQPSIPASLPLSRHPRSNIETVKNRCCSLLYSLAGISSRRFTHFPSHPKVILLMRTEWLPAARFSVSALQHSGNNRSPENSDSQSIPACVPLRQTLQYPPAFTPQSFTSPARAYRRQWVLLRKRKFRLSLTRTLYRNRIILRFRRLRRDSRFVVQT